MTHRRLGRWWSWPISVWNMYSYKSGVRRVVYFRRFLAYHADGRVTQTDMSDPIKFLVRPYRIDAGVSRNLPLLLIECLRVMRKTRSGADLIGLGFEGREWNYAADRTLADHYAHAEPVSNFRVMVAPEPPPTLRARAATPVNLVLNGEFRDWDGRSGFPLKWQTDAHPYLGVGVDLETEQRAAFIAASPHGGVQSLRQQVAMPTAASLGQRTVHVEALVRARPNSRATLNLQLQSLEPGSEAHTASSAPAPADDQWHRVELDQALPPEAELTQATLRLDAEGSAFFDDVVLSVSDAPAP
jgi:hypothetical protein